MTDIRPRSLSVRGLLPIASFVAVVGCIDDAPTAASGDALVNLAISAQVVGTGSEVVEISVFYLRGDGTLVGLPVSPDSVRLTTGATIQQPVVVDVTPCLSDPGVASGGCQLHVSLRLLDAAGALMDSATFVAAGPAVPGATITVPTVSLAGCGPMTPVPAGSLLSPLVATPATLRSVDSTTPATVQFVNGSCEPITLYWIDYEGGVVPFATLAPGQVHVQPTFVSHPWLASDTTGRSTLYTPLPGASVAYIARSLGIPSAAPVASLTLIALPDTTPLPVGQSRVVVAIPRDAQGSVLVGRLVTWTGGAAPIATTSTASGATLVAAGTSSGPVTLTASSGGVNTATTIQISVAWRSISTTRTNGVPTTCGVSSTDQGYCWGSNSSGQLGIGSADTLTHAVPIPVSGAHAFADIAVGGLSICGLTRAGQVYCWGAQFGTTPTNASSGLTFATISNSSNTPCGVTTANAAYCLVGSTWSPAFPGLTLDSISAGFNNRCAVTASGDIYCDGLSVFGALGNGSLASTSAPAQVLGGPYTTVSTGANFSCALATGGVAYCWGRGDAGQLGVPTSTLAPVCQPTTCSPSPVAVAGGITFTAISSGTTHACGIDTSGAAFCWGGNTFGELGNGTTVPSEVPVPVGGNLLFDRIEAGNATTCGVTIRGEAYCWGGNFKGRLGTGATAHSAVPVRVVSP